MNKLLQVSRLATVACLAGALVLASIGAASAADRGHRGGGHKGGGHKVGGHSKGDGHYRGNRDHRGNRSHRAYRGGHRRHHGGSYSFGYGVPFGYGGHYSFGYSGHHGGDVLAGAVLGVGLGYLLLNNQRRDRYPAETVVVERQVVKEVQRAPEPAYSCLQTREYQTRITVGGKEVDAYGTACLQPDGSWRHGPAMLVPQFD